MIDIVIVEAPALEMLDEFCSPEYELMVLPDCWNWFWPYPADACYEREMWGLN